MSTKILQITNKPAYPSVDGGCLGMAKMSDFYSSNPNFSLDILTLETFKHPFDEKEFRKSLSPHTAIYSVKVDTKPSVAGAIKALASNKSYNLTRFKTTEFEQKLTEILTNNKYDIIQLENIFVSQYIDTMRSVSEAKIILNSANIEYEIWQRMSQKSSWVRNKYFNILSKQLKQEEENIWKQVDGIICATDKDREVIEGLIGPKNLITLPFYLDLDKYIVTNNANNTPSFFHLGAMDWLPNIEGIEWFITSIWKNLEVSSVFHMAGKGMPSKFMELNMPNIQVSGFVENALDFMNRHDVMIVPLRSGSGIRVKIIEAMALGKCVISTSVGAEGICCEDKKNILIANSETEFDQIIRSLIANPLQIKAIGTEARKLVEKKYNIWLMEEKLTTYLAQITSIK